MSTKTLASMIASVALMSGCSSGSDKVTTTPTAQEKPMTVTPATQQVSPEDFLTQFNIDIKTISDEAGAAQWVRATYITEDTALLAAKASERYQAYLSQAVNQAKQFPTQGMSKDTARALKLLVLSTSMPAPADAKKRAELSRIATEMGGIYGAGEYCREDGSCLQLQELENILASSRNYDELLEVWQGWREVAIPLRPKYERFVELTNEGANEFGYGDLAQMWKANYDMPVAEFEQVVDGLWTQVQPLYEQLHCYVRHELGETYGKDKVDPNAPIPAHLLGNMWSQTWNNIYDVVEPFPGKSTPDVTPALLAQEYDAEKMTRAAEEFFVSLGLPELPDTFWQRSMLTKPRDRDVVCHASAWDLDGGKDPRIKQCVEPNAEQLSTLHHELGHIYYFLMYKDLEPLFRTGAHDGFHEAIGDTIVLSMTPEHLKKKGLIKDIANGNEAKINQQMRMALEKIAFLPFGKLIDEWRWKVFSKEIPPEQYNAAWWNLRRKYQGISPPTARDERYFDAGAKYHIPGNTPYIRYFLSFIIQFQFHKALCDTAGFNGEISDCSIYGSKEAGKQLGDVLAMGASQPWPKAMQTMTGQPHMDASALLEYFKPLQQWLSQENADRQCGW
ncbi:M2 family metallopeptidase [Marinagarivorans algicola]|uniref:M2 family metallopeptidase n=1 Tax=Marinagarivorans algicola TaxID=1513270 RepID=UPI0006B98016|nr:M2 family metallopeptidase [Marinagarivorans algicola]